MRELHLDMDGVLCDLYSQDWAADVAAENTACFEQAAPMVDMARLRRVLLNLRRDSIRVCINTHTPDGASPEYQHRVAQTKAIWLAVHLGLDTIDEFYASPYGTDKSAWIKPRTEVALLIDDSGTNRMQWAARGYDAWTEHDLVPFMELAEEEYGDE